MVTGKLRVINEFNSTVGVHCHNPTAHLHPSSSDSEVSDSGVPAEAFALILLALLMGSSMGHNHPQKLHVFCVPPSVTNQQGCWSSNDIKMLVHDQHQDFTVSQSYDYCMLTQHFHAKLRSVGEAPPDCPADFLDRKMQEEFAATQAEMQRPGAGPVFLPVIHGHPWPSSWGSPGSPGCAGNMLTPQRNCIRRYLGPGWLGPGWMFLGVTSIEIFAVPSPLGTPTTKSPVGRILMVPQLGEAQTFLRIGHWSNPVLANMG